MALPSSLTTLRIHELGSQGDGICRSERGAVFVEGALPGEQVQVSITRDKQGVARGKLIKVLSASPHRIAAPCPHFKDCGNCSVQQLELDSYRQWKLSVVEEALSSLKLRPQMWRPPVFLGENLRRRINFSLQRQGNQIAMGYFRRRSQKVIAIDTCLVAHPQLMELKSKIQPNLERILYGEETLDIFLQKVGKAVDVVLTGPVGRNGEVDSQVARELELLLKTKLIKRVTWRAEEESPLKMVACQDNINAKFGEIMVALPPDAFLQPTWEGEQALVKSVMELSRGIKAPSVVADLFSGCGTFSGPLLKWGRVDAFESSSAAVAALQKGSKGKALRVYRRDLFKNPLTRDELNQYELVVFDPPRAGALEQSAQLAKSKVPSVIAVSCQPQSFARDAKVLVDGGYQLETVQVVDQFLWSHHIELVASFIKRKA